MKLNILVLKTKTDPVTGYKRFVFSTDLNNNSYLILGWIQSLYHASSSHFPVRFGQLSVGRPASLSHFSSGLSKHAVSSIKKITSCNGPFHWVLCCQLLTSNSLVIPCSGLCHIALLQSHWEKENCSLCFSTKLPDSFEKWLFYSSSTFSNASFSQVTLGVHRHSFLLTITESFTIFVIWWKIIPEFVKLEKSPHWFWCPIPLCIIFLSYFSLCLVS